MELFETALIFGDFDKDILKHLLRMFGKAPKVATFGDIRLFECPNSYITPETIEMLQAVFLVTETHIPYFPGGWADQPHWLQEAVTLYKKEVADRMEKEREKNKQEKR